MMTAEELDSLTQLPTMTLERDLAYRQSLLEYLHTRAPGDEWIPDIEELIDVIKGELCKRDVL
jgi:hypothetical protein